MSNPSDFAPAAKYRQFFEKNVEFYEVILGKILKRFSAFEMCEELLGSLRAIIEFAWKEPQTLLLRHIQLDIQPHSLELLKQMQVVVRMHRSAIQKEQDVSFEHFKMKHSLTKKACCVGRPNFFLDRPGRDPGLIFYLKKIVKN